MKFLIVLVSAVALVALQANCILLDVNSTDSIKNASSTLAFGLMSSYSNNQSDTDVTALGTFNALPPWYWWEAGAAWGGLIDYWAYTGDTSYNEVVTQALLAQTGPNNNFMSPAYFPSLGNDDQAFWAITVLNAVEYDFPTPPENSTTVWLDLAEAVFNAMTPRWFTQECAGGLQWQVFQTNAGWGYKNSISNGGLFQIAARLAKITGNQTYIDWSEKIWDWMDGVGFIDQNYNVFDGAGSASNCTQIDKVIWTYNPSMLLYGAAVLYNYTGSPTWGQRMSGLLTACSQDFFSPYPNATNIMYERACEPYNNCDTDQYSFKAYLARWMAQAAATVPEIKDTVMPLLTASAQAAAQSCSGQTNGTVCGQKWYVGGYDGSFGIGQQLSALETVQSLLLLQGGVSPLVQAPAGAVHDLSLTTRMVTVTTTQSSCSAAQPTR